MPPVGFEPTISAGGRPQTYALDRAASGIGDISLIFKIKLILVADQPRGLVVKVSVY